VLGAGGRGGAGGCGGITVGVVVAVCVGSESCTGVDAGEVAGAVAGAGSGDGDGDGRSRVGTWNRAWSWDRAC
jgi:hypothetical protein